MRRGPIPRRARLCGRAWPGDWRRAVAVTVLVLLSTASVAQPSPPAPQPLPPPADLTPVKGLGNANGTSLRLQHKWNGALIFEIGAEGGYLEQVPAPDGSLITIQIDARPLIRAALADWTAAGLPLRAARSGESPSMRVGTGELASNASLGWTNVRTPVHEVTLSLRNIARQAARIYGDMTSQGVIDGRQVSINDFAAMLTSLTALHEIGHALGLVHPDASSGDELGGHFVTLMGATRNAQPPSIMIANSRVFLTLARRAAGRPVGPADIRLNQRDRLGARIMWNRNAGQMMNFQMMQCAMPRAVCGTSR